MTNINLLKDKGKDKKSSKGKGLLSLFRKKTGESESKPGEAKKEVEIKVRKPLSNLRVMLIFLLPVVACISLESVLKEEMKSAYQKLTQRLDAEKTKFQSIWKTPPPLKDWKKRYKNLKSARDSLSTFLPLNIQSARECIQQMSESLPPEVWIKRFSVSQNNQSQLKMIEIEGYAFTSETVLFFLSKLKDKPFYRNINLKYSEPTQENGIQEHRFLMHAFVPQNLFDAFNISPTLYNISQWERKRLASFSKQPTVWAFEKRSKNIVNFLGLTSRDMFFKAR